MQNRVANEKELEEIEDNISKWFDAQRHSEMIVEYYAEKIWEAQMRRRIILREIKGNWVDFLNKGDDDETGCK